MNDVIDAPHRLDDELDHAAKRQPERNGKPGTQIALPIAASDAVNSQHHHVDAGLLGSLQHGSVEAAILMEIELVDLRRIMLLSQLLQTDRAKRGNAEHGSVFCRGSRHGALALMVE